MSRSQIRTSRLAFYNSCQLLIICCTGFGWHPGVLDGDVQKKEDRKSVV